MKLSKKDVEMFYKLYHSLLVYVNKKFHIIEDIDSPKNLSHSSLGEINKIRDRLYERPEVIDSFVNENPLNFSSNELEITGSWRNFVKDRFYIFRYLKKHTVFLGSDDPPKAYGVLALKSTFEEMLGPYLPIMVEAVLLPFNDKIIYDSILMPYSITFGRSIRASLNDAYQMAKSRFGIITSLPFSPEKVEQSDKDRLRFYLKSQRNREMYREEIEALIYKDSNLLTVYHQEMGKIHARTYGKQLREIGLMDAWIAILEGLPIASGSTRNEVERILQRILSSEKRPFVYIFQLKRK